MAREYALPSSSTILQDFGLAISPQPTARNRRVVVIGTAEDGPLYEPVVIDQPGDAALVWGRQSQGDLVRGITESWTAQNGNQNVVGVRIGKAKFSELRIGERTGTGVDEKDSDDGITSLKLTGRFPGPIYDQITIGINSNGKISLYNPKTGLFTEYSFSTNPNNTNVDVNNVEQLVNRINSDRNMSSVVTASFDVLNCNYELKVTKDTAGVSSSDNSVTLDLSKILAVADTIADGIDDAYIVPSPKLPYPVGDPKNLTITNNISDLTAVQAIGISNWQLQPFDGITTTLERTPLDGKANYRWNTINALMSYDDDKFYNNPKGSTVSEYIYSVENLLIDEIPTDAKGVDGTNTFTMTSPLPFDDSDSEFKDDVVEAYLTAKDAYNDYYDSVGGNHDLATCKGIKDNAAGERPYGVIKVYASTRANATGSWTLLPYHKESGIYLSDFDETGEHTKNVFSIGPKAKDVYTDVVNKESITIDTGLPAESGESETKWTNIQMLIDEDGNIKEGVFLRVVAHTVKGFLSENVTLGELQNNRTAYPTSYFVRGTELLLNAPSPFPMVFNYGTIVNYEVGTDVVLQDAARGIISFNNGSNLPGPSGGPLTTDITHIHLMYEYLPNFPIITSSSKSLHGGTTGSKLTVKEREAEFRKVYEYLRDFEADIWVPMGAYIDAIKDDYDQNTGLIERTMNTFAQDIEDFLDEQSINLYQPHAVLGVTQIDGTTIGDRDMWVKNLTEIDMEDPTRAANVMMNIQNKFLSVVSFEPVFLNTGMGQPYSANGQAAYAGVIAGMPYDISPTNKTIPGIYATRFPFTMRQLEQLNGMRYVALRTSDSRPPVIVNDITAAPFGSDYVNWSIFSITKEAADRIKFLADTYIGRPNSVEVKNALDQDVSNILKNMSGIQAFNFTISSSIDQQILGVVEIDLVIVPVFTMKKIRTTIKLRKNASI